MSDAQQDQASDPDRRSCTTDNAISLGGIDVEALNVLAEKLQERLKGGFGDWHEEGSRSDNRHHKLSMVYNLLAKLEEVTQNQQKILTALALKDSDSGSMGEGAGMVLPLGGKAKTLAAQVQTLQEMMGQVVEKNEKLEQEVKAAATQAKEATRKMEATQLENETIRKDLDRQEKKLKEVERKIPKAAAKPDQSRWDEQFEGLQVQVQAAANKATRAIEKADLLKDRITTPLSPFHKPFGQVLVSILGLSQEVSLADYQSFLMQYFTQHVGDVWSISMFYKPSAFSLKLWCSSKMRTSPLVLGRSTGLAPFSGDSSQLGKSSTSTAALCLRIVSAESS